MIPTEGRQARGTLDTPPRPEDGRDQTETEQSEPRQSITHLLAWKPTEGPARNENERKEGKREA